MSQKYDDSEYKKGQCAIMLCSKYVRESENGNEPLTYKIIIYIRNEYMEC